MNALSPRDRRVLIGVLGRLGSDQDGEVLAAAHKATELVRQRGLQWESIILPQLEAPGADAPPFDRGWRAVVAWLLETPDLLQGKEREFLVSLRGWSHLSPKQTAWLKAIAERVAAWRSGAP